MALKSRIARLEELMPEPSGYAVLWVMHFLSADPVPSEEEIATFIKVFIMNHGCPGNNVAHLDCRGWNNDSSDPDDDDDPEEDTEEEQEKDLGLSAGPESWTKPWSDFKEAEDQFEPPAAAEPVSPYPIPESAYILGPIPPVVPPITPLGRPRPRSYI
jgi:hypothetical protein